MTTSGGLATSPTGVTTTINSYLYQQYSDDDNLQAFVDAYNAQTLAIVNWFNQIELPVYTSNMVVGTMLDWVAQGLYGLTRPVITNGTARYEGPLDTFVTNTLPFNQTETIEPNTYIVTTDDIFKRVITWWFYKGDGQVFNIRWLKRRVCRFLFGVNGTDVSNGQTYQVRVEFGSGNNVNIYLLTGAVQQTRRKPAINAAPLLTVPINQNIKYTVVLPSIPMASTFQAAVNSGALCLPFQFTFNVVI